MAVNQPEHAKQSQRQRARGRAGEDDRTDMLRAMLLDRRNALTREIDALVARMSAQQGVQREQAVADTVDLSLQSTTGDHQVLMLELRQDTRNEIDEALRRLDEGIYGICGDCGARINTERLRAVPFARRCVECPRKAEEVERIEKKPGPGGRGDVMALHGKKTHRTSTLLVWAVLLSLAALMPEVVSAGPKAEAGGNAVEKDAVRKVLGRFVTAWNRDDTDALVQLFLPDGSFISATGASATSRDDIKRLLRAERDLIFKGTTLTKTIHSITFEERHTAQVTGVYELEGLDMLMVPVAPDGAFRFVLTKKGNQWLIQRASIAHT